jgi:hypothetical protein
MYPQTTTASKGGTAHYHYYHCHTAGSYRRHAEDANGILEDYLKEYALNPNQQRCLNRL